ncbi:MAG: response regulator, partial [Anaerolineae bacterium]|nr:response regulator [Anaerolineae bacterium]
MSSADSVSQAFVRQVRSALAHLYDYAYLQNHPLAALIDPAQHLDRVSRGQTLRRLLLDCIEALRPQQDDSARPEAARAHSMLTFHFVDGVPVKEIAALRALGQRQAYREMERSVEAVARVLHDRLREGARDLRASDAPGDPLQTAQAEVARLRENLHAESLDLREVLHGVLELMQPVAESTGLRIILSPTADWPPVLADRVMLRQALLNLLTHALHAVVRGDLTISATAGPGELHLQMAESPVTSRTCPIPPPVEGQARVSLPVCEALLAAQGGRLETHREGGCWQASIALPTPGRMTILVVDDNRDLVSLIRRYLAGHDLQVLGATGAEEALHLAAQLQPRLITLDVMMPNQDGWEALQKLKASPVTRHIPVVVCSVL